LTSKARMEEYLRHRQQMTQIIKLNNHYVTTMKT